MIVQTYALDQQGGKGNAGWALEVCPTICSDSHGTPHAVAYLEVTDDLLDANSELDGSSGRKDS